MTFNACEYPSFGGASHAINSDMVRYQLREGFLVRLLIPNLTLLSS